jgi:hypothetical protein
VSWDQKFFDPIILPDDRKPLVTLRDAAEYITELPKAEHDADQWQAAMQALLLVAEHDGPTMLARIGIMRALNRGHVRELTSRKDQHWRPRKLKRDQRPSVGIVRRGIQTLAIHRSALVADSHAIGITARRHPVVVSS